MKVVIWELNESSLFLSCFAVWKHGVWWREIQFPYSPIRPFQSFVLCKFLLVNTRQIKNADYTLLTVFWERFCGNMIITTPFIFLIPLFIKGSQWLRCARDHARVWLLDVGGRLPLFDGGPTSGPHPGQILWTDHWYAPKIIMARKTQYRIFTKKWQLYKRF